MCAMMGLATPESSEDLEITNPCTTKHADWTHLSPTPSFLELYSNLPIRSRPREEYARVAGCGIGRTEPDVRGLNGGSDIAK
jgi:hypothetical protein